MTADNFTKAARAEAGQYELDKAANIEAWERHPHDQGSRIGFKQGAEWGYDQPSRRSRPTPRCWRR